MGYTKDVTCDAEKTDQIVKLLDAGMQLGADFMKYSFSESCCDNLKIILYNTYLFPLYICISMQTLL